MRTGFVFDSRTGTMVSSGIVEEGAPKAKGPVPDGPAPVFQKKKSIVAATGPLRGEVLRMKRTDGVSQVVLVDGDGVPETYLDTETAGVVMFRELEDYDRCQITDEKTGTVIGIIGGYALDISFNMAELDTPEKVEQCLQGLVKLFRHKIMSRTFSSGQTV